MQENGERARQGAFRFAGQCAAARTAKDGRSQARRADPRELDAGKYHNCTQLPFLGLDATSGIGPIAFDPC